MSENKIENINSLGNASQKETVHYYSLLDILRFLAALFVMLFHYFSGGLQNIIRPLSKPLFHATIN